MGYSKKPPLFAARARINRAFRPNAVRAVRKAIRVLRASGEVLDWAMADGRCVDVKTERDALNVIFGGKEEARGALKFKSSALLMVDTNAGLEAVTDWSPDTRETMERDFIPWVRRESRKRGRGHA